MVLNSGIVVACESLRDKGLSLSLTVGTLYPKVYKYLGRSFLFPTGDYHNLALSDAFLCLHSKDVA